tara:strand:+ start:319 stop:1086 length:768 start_codon:yes stop_codon:yes gene_type:complete
MAPNEYTQVNPFEEDASQSAPSRAEMDREFEDAPTPDRRKTFTSLWGLYAGQFKGEEALVEQYGKDIEADIEDAQRRRKEASEAQSDVGWFTAFVSALAVIATGGSALLAGGLGAVGYGAGSGAYDYFNDAEEYGLTTGEHAQNVNELKYLGDAKEEIQLEGERMQRDLDDYDRNEWKQHVFGAINAGWNIYKFAGLGTSVLDWIKGDVVEDVAEEAITSGGLDLGKDATLMESIDLETALDIVMDYDYNAGLSD